MEENSTEQLDLKKRPLIVGNWKMYKTIEEATSFLAELLPLIEKQDNAIYLAVPYTLIRPLVDEAKGSSLMIGAQNMNDAEEGAFTGEIAAKMLVDAGARFVILGHSERRRIFQETNDFINKKVKRALRDGLDPLLCVGETLEEREAGRTKEVLEDQLEKCLEGIKEEDLKKLMIAYEPVWAIGAGFPATVEVALEAVEICRSFLKTKYLKEVEELPPILYGGSVTSQSSKSFLDEKGIDGLLVGGASLSAETFSKIIHYHEELNP